MLEASIYLVTRLVWLLFLVCVAICLVGLAIILVQAMWEIFWSVKAYFHEQRCLMKKGYLHED